MRVWHSSGQYDNEYLALIDTGSKENFILRSVVEDLELRTMRKFPMTIKTLAGHKVEVSECVQPMWKFSTSSRRHQEYPFHVVPEIPSGIDMVLGNIAREDMGIELRDNGSALIAHEDPEGSFHPFSSSMLGLIVNATVYRSSHSATGTATA